MPRPYQPPLSRRPQAVQSAEPPSSPRPRWLWAAVLLLVLGPVVAVVLATELPFGRPPAAETPVAQAPTAVPQAQPAAQATPTVIVSSPAGPGQPAATAAATTTPVTAAAGSPTTPAGAAAAASPTPSTAAAAPGGAESGATLTAGTPTDSPTAAETGVSGPFRAYRVQPGDTVRFVSEMFGVSSASVINASGLDNPDRLRVGQVLTIPLEPGYLYRVKPGETLDQIAIRTGVSSETIASASRLGAGGVRAGDVLLIPELTAARVK